MTMDHKALVERWHSFEVPANIYRVDPTLEPLDDVIGLAERVGVARPTEASAWTEAGPLLELQQEPYTFTVYRPSRAVRFVDNERWQVDDGTTDLRLTDSEAFDAAIREAERAELFGQDQFTPFRVTRLHVASAEKGQEPSDVRVIDTGVILTRQLDGIRFEGQGGNVVMYLGPEGDLTGFERVARRIAEVREPVSGWRSLDEVLAETEGYLGLRHNEEFVIEDARMGYLELGRLQEQDVIQPVYVLALRLGNGRAAPERRVEHAVPAAVNGVGPLLPPPDPALTRYDRES